MELFDGSQSLLTIDGVDYTITAGTESFTLCLDLTACTVVTFNPATGWNDDCSWDVTDAFGAVIASGGPASGTVGAGCVIPGCTDPLATNFDPTATVDDGSCIAPAVPNDTQAGAELLTMTAFGTCTSVSGTTAGATDSPESVNLYGGEYIDVWYEIVATEAGVRIAVVTSSMDCMLELLDDQGGLVATADLNGGDAGEILFSNLTPGDSYFLSVQDYFTDEGTFEICAQELPAAEVYVSDIDRTYPCSGYRGLSASTFVSVAGGGTDWTFDDGVNTPITYSTDYSSVNLDLVPGIQSGLDIVLEAGIKNIRNKKYEY